MSPLGVTRRRLLASAAGAGLLPRAAAADTAAPPRLMVAGPDGCPLDGWAAALAPALARGLAPRAQLRIVSLGGVDGVTGANQFEARVAPDGETARLVVGRVDPASWTRTHNLRVAGAGPAGLALAMMLGLELLGVSFTPVFGFTSSDARTALASGRAQVVLLAGANVPEQAEALAA